MKINKKFLFVVIPIVLGIILCDLLTKHFVISGRELGETESVIAGLFNFTYVQNFGAAWSMFSGNGTFLLVMSFVFVSVLMVFYFLERKNGVLFHVGWALILGGAIGNLVDRIAFGYVRDFIQFDFWKAFPVFNVADIALTFGVILLLVYYAISLFKRRKNAGKN